MNVIAIRYGIRVELVCPNNILDQVEPAEVRVNTYGCPTEGSASTSSRVVTHLGLAQPFLEGSNCFAPFRRRPCRKIRNHLRIVGARLCFQEKNLIRLHNEGVPLTRSKVKRQGIPARTKRSASSDYSLIIKIQKVTGATNNDTEFTNIEVTVGTNVGAFAQPDEQSLNLILW